MADDNVDLGSVWEFAQDIATQEAPPPLPARKYVGEITGAMAKQSGKGNIYIDVEFTIQPDQFPADYNPSNREPAKLHYRRLVVSPDTDRNRYGLRKFCEAIRVVPSRRIDINDWIGKVATLDVGTSKYMGEERAEIKAVEIA